ncbi:MAG: hypothetical protein NVSMB42_08550 [Herpetosiphon sp.]
MWRKRCLMVLAFVGVIGGMWQMAKADAPVIGDPAQQQIQAIMPDLLDSEASHVMGAYYPGSGAYVSFNLLRGPNTRPPATPADGTRDWMIYLMQKYGAKLTAVPANEKIAMSVTFYDYTAVVYHQLVVSAPAARIGDTASYAVWLDGKPYSGQAMSVATPSPTGTALSGGYTIDLAFDRPDATTRDWTVVGGSWELAGGAYSQKELDKYDLLSFYNRRIAGDYTLRADMQLLEGKMGGGLVFNAPSATSKEGAAMVSYTGGGSYLQWGYFDANGVFQFQGGRAVPNGGNGQAHTVVVHVTGTSFDVSVDSTVVGQKVALARRPQGFVGLMTSTSRVSFKKVAIEGIQP